MGVIHAFVARWRTVNAHRLSPDAGVMYLTATAFIAVVLAARLAPGVGIGGASGVDSVMSRMLFAALAALTVVPLWARIHRRQYRSLSPRRRQVMYLTVSVTAVVATRVWVVMPLGRYLTPWDLSMAGMTLVLSAWAEEVLFRETPLWAAGRAGCDCELSTSAIRRMVVWQLVCAAAHLPAIGGGSTGVKLTAVVLICLVAAAFGWLAVLGVTLGERVVLHVFFNVGIASNPAIDLGLLVRGAIGANILLMVLLATRVRFANGSRALRASET
jgi:hypothetical protein